MTDAVNEKELQKERKEIIARILEIQKKFMESYNIEESGRQNLIRL